MASLITIVRNSKSDTLSLRFLLDHDLCSTEFLEALRSVQPPGGWKILVVDDHAQRLLGAVLKQFDILAEHVTRAWTTTSYCAQGLTLPPKPLSDRIH